MSTTIEQSVAPHSIEAEQAVLGALLRFNDCIDKLGDLQAKHFHRADHREIFGEIQRQIVACKPCDVISVWTALESRQSESTRDALPYLHQLAQSVPSSVHAGQHATAVVDRALRRGIIHVADVTSGLAHSPKGKSADEVLDAMQSMVTTLAEKRVRNEPRMIGELLPAVLEAMGERAEGRGHAMATGIEPIDKKLNGGLRPGQLIIVAGRPSMGKTALTSDIGLNMGEQYSVLNFSMEMEGQEIASRALANRGRVALASILGTIPDGSDPAWAGITAATLKLNDVRFAIDDTPAISLLELRMKAKAWKRKHGLDVIIVDYLGLMTGGDGDKRHEQIGSYSRGLKALAKELGVAVIALAQLNRKVEDRPDRRPVLSDLRDSGEIEQDADIVMLVHRPEMYDPENRELEGFAEVLVRKHRSGQLGDIPLRFDGAHCRFAEWYGTPPTTPMSGKKAGRPADFRRLIIFHWSSP